jgi:iron-sulfur cluster repair protein YtfE (RIC family)
MPGAVTEMDTRPQEAGTLTQPLRDEHKELLVRFESLRTVADSVGDVSPEEVRRGVSEVYEFLTHHLIPHAQAEDQALYPVVARVMGAPQATATMSRDHVEAGRLTEELKSLRTRLSGVAVGEAEARPCAAFCTVSMRSSRCTSQRRKRSTFPSWTRT